MKGGDGRRAPRAAPRQRRQSNGNGSSGSRPMINATCRCYRFGAARIDDIRRLGAGTLPGWLFVIHVALLLIHLQPPSRAADEWRPEWAQPLAYQPVNRRRVSSPLADSRPVMSSDSVARRCDQPSLDRRRLNSIGVRRSADWTALCSLWPSSLPDVSI